MGERRLGAWTGLGAAASLIVTFHVILQTPKLPWMKTKRQIERQIVFNFVLTEDK